MRSTRLVLLSLSLGCGSAGSTADGTGSSTSAGTTADALPGSTSADSRTGGASEDSGSGTTADIAWETEGADEGYGTTGDCGFTCPQPPGGGGGNNGSECSFTEQDCGDGETCMPWDNSGGRTWNALRCVPLDESPAGLGEPCVVEGSFLSGIDDCAAGLWCGPDTAEAEEAQEGTCKQLCNAGPCPSGTTCVVPGTVFVGVCEPPCDPLVEDACVAGQACMPAGFGFACHVAEPRSVGSECFAHSQCAPGSTCIEAPQCGGEGESCCVALCDLSDPQCPEAQTCLDQGSPLPVYENVGYCSAG